VFISPGLEPMAPIPIIWRPIIMLPPPIIGWPAILGGPARPLLTPLNLTANVLCGPLETRSKVGVGRSNLTKQLALCNPGEPLAGPLQALRADVNAVVQLKVDHRNDSRVGNAVTSTRWASCTAFQPLGSDPFTTGRSGRSKKATRAGRSQSGPPR